MMRGVDRRGALALGAGLATLPIAARAGGQWDAVVDPRTGTLAEALARAQAAPHGFRILLLPGLFTEKVTVEVPGVTIAGSGPGTILSYGANNGGAKPGGGTWGTGGSATLTIAAAGVTLSNLTVRNHFDYIGAKRDGAGNGAQAVALRIAPEADRTTVTNCRLEGYQDTLYVQARSRIAQCRIAGGVDFIFGPAAAWFDRCAIVTRFVPGAETFGYVCAPSTPLVQRYGLIFSHCRLGRERGVTDRSTWLGRPWRTGGDMALTGQAVFLDCWMDAHIQRQRWTWMGYTGPGGAQRQLTPQEARLFEYRSRGPGAGEAGDTRRLLSSDQAAAFTAANVLGDWR